MGTPPAASPPDADLWPDECSGNGPQSTRHDVRPAGRAAAVQIPTRRQHLEAAEQPDAAGTPTTQAFFDLVAQMNLKTAHAGKAARRLPDLCADSGIAGPASPAGLLVPAAFSPALGETNNSPAAAGGNRLDEERVEWCVDLETAPLLGPSAKGAGVGERGDVRLGKGKECNIGRILLLCSLAGVVFAVVAFIVGIRCCFIPPFTSK